MTASHSADTAGFRARDRLDVFAVGLVILLSLTWGLNQVAVKVANHGFQPVFQAGVRSLFGGLLVLAWCRARHISLIDRDGTLIPGIVAGLLFGGEFILYFIGLDYTTVSRGSVLIYLAPFVVAIGGHFFIPGERLTVLRVAGLAAAFAGVLVAFSDRLTLSSSTTLLGDGLCIAAAVLWGATTVLIKATRLARTTPEKVLVYQLAVSAILMFAVAPFFGPFIRQPDGLAVSALLFQIVVVVAGSYLAWFWLLVRFPAGRLTVFTFLTPVFGVLFGGLLLSEPVSLRLVVALVLIATGIVLVNRRSA